MSGYVGGPRVLAVAALALLAHAAQLPAPRPKPARRAPPAVPRPVPPVVPRPARVVLPPNRPDPARLTAADQKRARKAARRLALRGAT